MPTPPPEEMDIGLRTYLTDTAGIGGRLRAEPEDFRVIELGDDPKPDERGRFSVARIRLRNWETNRFAGRAVRELRLRQGQVNFAGMKDKRAVTEQWFSFKCKPDRVHNLTALQDVEITAGPYATQRAQYAGAHSGNRFELRVREHNGEILQVDQVLDKIRELGGVPNWFGPQRFGAGVRPVTAQMGAAIVAGDLEEAVRLYVGNPHPGEQEEARIARGEYEANRDPEAALAIFPARLGLERSILERLVKDPENWRYALQALPKNLLQLFIHSHQSRIFNEIISARIAAGFPVNGAQIGDLVMGISEDGINTVPVTAANQARVAEEIARGRATVTAPLVGMDSSLADGEIGEIERGILAAERIEPNAFRCRELPVLASKGRRRGTLMAVSELTSDVLDGDPVVGFSLGRGGYATIVMREVMKAPINAY